MFEQISNNFKAILLAFAGFTAFAVSDAIGKYLTAYYEPFVIVAGNAAVALCVALLFSKPLGGLGKTLRTEKLKIHLGRGVCNIATSFLVVVCFAKLPLATIYTLIFVAPFITTVLAIPIYKEKVERHAWIAIASGFLGVLIVLRPGFEAFNPWLLLPLLIAVFVSGLFLLARALGDQETLLSLALFPAIFNFAVMAPLVFFLHDMPDASHFPHFITAGIMIVAGLSCTAQAFRIGKASVVSPIHYSQMIWAVIFGYFIFGDVIDLWTFTGALIIIGGGIYLIETERRFSRYSEERL